jgi:hypothetical protein
LVGWEGAADDERGGEGAGRVREKEGPEEVERRGRREGASGATTVLILSLSLSFFSHILPPPLPLTSADAGAPAVVEGIAPRGLSGAANSRPSAASSSAASRLSLFFFES